MRSSQVGGSARKQQQQQRRVVFEDSSSSSSAAEEEAAGDRGWGMGENEIDEDEIVELPVSGKKRRRNQRATEVSEQGDSSGDEDVRGKVRGAGNEETDDDDDDIPLVTPTAKRKRRLVVSDDDDDDHHDHDNQLLASSPVKRRRLVRGAAASSPVKQSRKDDEDDQNEQPAPSSVRARRTGRRPLTKKEKARELLRRKRAGEVINESEEGEKSEEEEPQRAMYDTDSDNPALNEFEDDEEGVLGEEDNAEKKKSKNSKEQKKKQKDPGDDDRSGSDEDMSDFVVDDSDAPLGIPDEVYMNMPLEFTAHSHKPLKEHFRDAIEWLVQFKINPGFSEKEHPLYRMAWKKLDDEVRGLAQSKFASSAWKVDFTMALRARPYFTNGELPKGDMLEAQSCGACGRSGHPARYMITFSGTPYYKDSSKLDRLLQPVEVDSSDSSSGSQHDEDEDGNSIPNESKQWLIGVVCNSNAETAHNLIHWKHGLLDWVDSRLHEEGYMAPSKLAERERMRPKQKYKLVDKILQRWVDTGVVKALYGDFKATIEQARNKPTTGRYR
ncbi:hypothetical protein VTI74DRAFT_2477 [Chaetomium olivicolor]